MNRLVLARLVARASASAPSSSRSPPSWRSWRPSLGAAENAAIRVFLPTSSRRTLRTAPFLALPMGPLPQATRSRCCQHPQTSRSSCTALRPKRADRRDRGGETGLPEGEVPRGTLQSSSTTVATRSRPKLEVDVPGMVRYEVLLEVLHDQVHLQVRGVPQVDDAGDSI